MTSARPRPRRLTALAPRSPRIEVTAARTTIRATPTIVTGLPPRLATDHAALDYRANDFRNRLQDAQRARVVPLPGAAAPRIGGLRLRVAPSARDIVRQLTVASRCTAERFKMRASTTQFITAQLLDRALEADGCGPHAGRTSASEAVDAVSRELMDER